LTSKSADKLTNYATLWADVSRQCWSRVGTCATWPVIMSADNVGHALAHGPSSCQLTMSVMCWHMARHHVTWQCRSCVGTWPVIMSADKMMSKWWPTLSEDHDGPCVVQPLYSCSNCTMLHESQMPLTRHRANFYHGEKQLFFKIYDPQ